MTKKQVLIILFILAITLSWGILGYLTRKKPPLSPPAPKANQVSEINVNDKVPGAEEPKSKEQETLEESSGVDTSDWLTYRNEEYGFEFKYPEGWGEIQTFMSQEGELKVYEYFPIISVQFASFKDSQNHMSIGLTPEEIYVNVSLLRNQNRYSLSKFIEWYDNLFVTEIITKENTREIIVDKIPSIRQIRIYKNKYASEPGENDTIFIPVAIDKVLEISFSNIDIYKAKRYFDPFIEKFLDNFVISTALQTNKN